jgi:SAM-dependent methyltransferase
MTDVLEHLPDPVGSLRRCRELLAPGGRLLITTPAVGCMSQRLLGRVWFQFKDEHLRLFTPEALRTALERAGLEIEATGAVRKTLSLAFVSGHFDAYPRAVLTPMLRGLTRVLGPLARLPMPMASGEMWAIARGA